MPIGMAQLTGDLAEETRGLRGLLGGLDASGWERPTPAEGWSVRDQVSHLAHFDDAALLAATDPDAFRAGALELSGGRLTPDDIATRHRRLPADRLLGWFDTSRARLISTFAGLEPGRRVPWYGPPMSVASSVTARIMETWAHGYDVADALGVTPEPSDRLRHVAHIGVRAMPFSYALRGRPAPAEAVRVELTSPGGRPWVWGPEDAPDRVVGPALDFCLLVTQRRHPDDLALRITGPVAGEWVCLAQAFAGEPGPGRSPLSVRPSPSARSTS